MRGNTNMMRRMKKATIATECIQALKEGEHGHDAAEEEAVIAKECIQVLKEGEPEHDAAEKEAVIAKECIQAFEDLVTKENIEIDELEKDLLFLQVEVASAGREHWLNEFYNAFRDRVDWLEMALVGLRNNIMTPNEARRRLYREPAKELNVIMFSLSSSGMATVEFHDPCVVPPAPSIDHYPEIIMAAIQALNEPNGSNKSTIFKHIQSTYGKLPAAHNPLLSEHLTKLINSGQLVLVRNNYMKPDPNASLNRVCGRPPRPRNPRSSAAAVSPDLCELAAEP